MLCVSIALPPSLLLLDDVDVGVLDRWSEEVEKDPDREKDSSDDGQQEATLTRCHAGTRVTPNERAFSGEPSERSERPERGRRVRCNAMLGGLVIVRATRHMD
jgi:hypothetical protein